MKKPEKIFKLDIDLEDELSGIDSISLVDEPAIEVNFLMFKKDNGLFNIPDGEDDKYLAYFDDKGESEEELINDGWVITSIEELTPEQFALRTNPNQESEADTEDTRVRYKYDLRKDIKQPSIIPTSRTYCRILVRKNYVYTREEVFNLPPNTSRDDGGFGGNPAIWRGGYNCRHNWYKILYKKEGKIINKASVKKNRKTDEAGRGIDLPTEWVQGDTVTSKTRNNPSPETIRNLGLSKDPCGCGDNCKVEDYTQKLSFNEEKRIVVGPAMIPNQNIIRSDNKGNPYYVYFTEDSIRKIEEKYMRNKYIDNNDVGHDGEARTGNFILESWIKEFESDKSVGYGFKDLPIGTWFVKMKINDNETWKQIKEGKLKGFSVSGFFEELPVEMSKEDMFLNELLKLFK